MAYLVLKGGGFWRKRQSLVFRDVRVVRLFGLRRVLKSERYIQKKAVIVLEGGAGTGKTRELLKVSSASDKVFGAEGVYIACGEGLENWFKRAGLSAEELKGLKQFEKIEKMVEKLKGKVVCLDDVDRLDSKDSKVKMSAVKQIIRVAKVVVLSCASIKKVNASIVEELRKKLRLKAWEVLETLDLGGSQSEIKDVGMIVAIVMVVIIALAWNITAGLLSALALRWLVNEGKRA